MIGISDLTIEAIKNEYKDICDMLSPNVTIRRLKPSPGSLCSWEFTVNAPTYYVKNAYDRFPKRTDSIVFYFNIPSNYPKSGPHIYYPHNKMLASVNVYTSGTQCIDQWLYDAERSGSNSSLESAVRKTIMDIIHDPSVTRFDSMANSSLCCWQKSMFASGKLPTCSLSHVFKPETGSASMHAAPPLPGYPKYSRQLFVPDLPIRR